MRLNNYPLPTNGLLVRPSFRIENKGLDGSSSATDLAHEGIKPVVIAVSFQLDFKQADILAELVAMAQAKDDNGDLVVYSVTDLTCNAMGVKKAVFDGEFSPVKDGDNEAWIVRFSLRQKRSTPELVEQRKQLSTDSSQAESAGSFEAVLNSVNERLAK